MLLQLCSSWQDFDWNSASRGPSAIAELLVGKEEVRHFAWWRFTLNSRSVTISVSCQWQTERYDVTGNVVTSPMTSSTTSRQRQVRRLVDASPELGGRSCTPAVRGGGRGRVCACVTGGHRGRRGARAAGVASPAGMVVDEVPGQLQSVADARPGTVWNADLRAMWHLYRTKLTIFATTDVPSEIFGPVCGTRIEKNGLIFDISEFSHNTA